jgi:hypothetical protein
MNIETSSGRFQQDPGRVGWRHALAALLILAGFVLLGRRLATRRP